MNNAFGQLLRFWRNAHEQSQEQLANLLQVSTRHISRLETGNVHPSETMVQTIVAHYQLNERDSHNLTMAAGYSLTVVPQDIHSPNLRWLRKAARLSVDAASPNPASLVDRYGRLIMVNRAWVGLFVEAVGTDALLNHDNLYVLMFEAMREATDKVRTQRTCALIMMALHQEWLITGDEQYKVVCDRLQATQMLPDDWPKVAASLDPMTSYVITLQVNNQPADLLIVNQIIGATGPASYISEPKLTLSAFYATNQALDLTILERHCTQHPLL